ncbi:MAG TPA: FtsQ-type POTRA domain-containing protein, partial [Pseudonocardiaceae bacterium]|nr:FtsQ-type POTRA domain-containing protein [Pseudonocardiaceae bacterium]
PPRAVAPRPPRPPRPPRLHRTARRRRRLRLVAGLVMILTLAGAATWVLVGSSLLDARSVQVIGTRELTADHVRASAAVPLGTPMLLLDTGQIAARVAAVPRVAAVEVSRSLPDTVRIAVTERSPAAVWPAPDGVHLVDATGMAYATVPEPPVGVPELRVSAPRPGDPVTTAAVTVLEGLPAPLRVQVRAVGADSPADVVLWLDDERQVHWGGVEDGVRKAAVLGPLLSQPGEIYDVSSPDLPTIS